jgi:hypothetical protein
MDVGSICRDGPAKRLRPRVTAELGSLLCAVRDTGMKFADKLRDLMQS